MKKRCLRYVLALLLVVILPLAVATQGTVAFSARTKSVVNRFTLDYMRTLTLPVQVKKTVTSLGKDVMTPEGFVFLLQNMNNGEVTTLTTDAAGYATADLNFTSVDAGKTFEYRLYELNDGRPYVTYSEAVYDVSVTLALDENKMLTHQVKVNGVPVTVIEAPFENVYAPFDIPVTGDERPLALWAVMLLAAGAGMIILRKRMAH